MNRYRVVKDEEPSDKYGIAIYAKDPETYQWVEIDRMTGLTRIREDLDTVVDISNGLYLERFIFEDVLREYLIFHPDRDDRLNR